MASPVRYSPTLEQAEPDEAETIDALREQFRIILETTSADYGHAVRAVHAKGHGLVRATLTVADGLPADLAQGMFAGAGSYETILRFSTNAGDILDDAITLPRGMAMKVMGVSGERLPGAGGHTQDFVMANAPTFAAPTPKAFLANLRMLAKTTDRGEGAKKMLSAVLRTAESALEAVGGRSALLTTLGGAKPFHPLGQTYFTQTALRYGDHVAKLQFVPVSGIADYARDTIDPAGPPDAIRAAMNTLLAEQGGTWELRAQLNTDPEGMPIEDPTVAWPEALSPYRTVATVTAAPQAAWQHPASDRLEDGLSFSPWHGLAAHQPLGGVNRVRRELYRFSTEYRANFNRCPVHEPGSLSELAD